ncbi:hypothetical protein V6N11_006914 [Hibiscus sabdariffa]|uniref:RNase H type-1 domain-containing protein n=1 Tax=Hibiscus sabdariffa TaxID=183260 RepID=A0ABR2RS36_9ROSI
MLSSSSGIVFRNHEGLLLAVAVYPHSHIPNPCVAEAQACLDAISSKICFFATLSSRGIHLLACNKVAHKTALLGRNFASFLVWVEEAPTVIEAVAQKDRRWVDPPD